MMMFGQAADVENQFRLAAHDRLMRVFQNIFNDPVGKVADYFAVMNNID